MESQNSPLGSGSYCSAGSDVQIIGYYEGWKVLKAVDAYFSQILYEKSKIPNVLSSGVYRPCFVRIAGVHW